MDLKNCTALVTGGAVRVGATICRALASHGAAVVIHCRHSTAEAGNLAAQLRRLGGRAWVVRGALDTETGMERVLAAAFRVAPALNVLVNNASVFARHPLLGAKGRDYNEAWRVNALAPILLTRGFAMRVAPAARPKKPGRGAIVNILDRRVETMDAGCAPYLVSKCALAAFTVASARELAPHISVNAVAPGPVLPPPGGVRRVREPAGRIPLDRRPTPEDVAEAVIFLVSSGSITGQTIFVDGGQHLER